MLAVRHARAAIDLFLRACCTPARRKAAVTEKSWDAEATVETPRAPESFLGTLKPLKLGSADADALLPQ